MMTRNFKLFLTYSTIFALLTGGSYIKTCRDKSRDFAAKTKYYVTNFEDDNYKIAAHRGYTQDAIENTVDAFRDAEKAKFVDYIELDTRLSADGELVVIHDSSVKLKNPNKSDYLTIEETYFEEIVNGEFKYTPNKAEDFFKAFFSSDEGVMIQEKLLNSFGESFSISSLEDAIEACGDKPILLDLKFKENYSDFYETLKVVLGKVENKNIILQSADLDALCNLQRLLPEYRYLAIVNSTDDFEKCKSFEMIGVRQNLIGEAEVDQALDAGKELSVWTINTTKQLDDVVAAVGDDATKIIYVTDYPAMVAQHLNNISIQKKKVTD